MRAATEQAVAREPSCERMCSVRCNVQTRRPASRQRDSVGSAEERRRVVSRRCVRKVSSGCCLPVRGVSIWLRTFQGQELLGKKVLSYLPASKAGEASGESSMVMVKMPSNFRSGKGAVMLAATRARTLRKTSMKFQSHPPAGQYLNRKKNSWVYT